MARQIGAHIYGLSATFAPEAGRAFAPEIVDQIETGAIVGAGLELLAALVDVYGAIFATITWRAEAHVFAAHAAMQTVGILRALELDFRLEPLKTHSLNGSIVLVLLRSAPILEGDCWRQTGQLGRSDRCKGRQSGWCSGLLCSRQRRRRRAHCND